LPDPPPPTCASIRRSLARLVHASLPEWLAELMAWQRVVCASASLLLAPLPMMALAQKLR
jgi:hypothetical protein